MSFQHFVGKGNIRFRAAGSLVVINHGLAEAGGFAYANISRNNRPEHFFREMLFHLADEGVTLGGTGKEKGKRHPTLGNNVMVGAGARVLGPFKVGDNAKIAANAVVLEAVPPNCTAVGVPARIVRRNGKKVNINSDLDQIHIPDPVAQELCRHLARIEKLEKKINKLEISDIAKKFNDGDK